MTWFDSTNGHYLHKYDQEMWCSIYSIINYDKALCKSIYKQKLHIDQKCELTDWQIIVSTVSEVDDCRLQAQGCSNSSVLAMKLLQSSPKPLLFYYLHKWYYAPSSAGPIHRNPLGLFLWLFLSDIQTAVNRRGWSPSGLHIDLQLFGSHWRCLGIWKMCPGVLVRCYHIVSLIARFIGPTWGPSGADRNQVGSMLAPWTLHSTYYCFMTYP